MLIEIYLIHRWNIVVVFIPSRKFARTIEANLSRCVSLVHWKTLLRFRIGNFLLLAGFIVLTLVSKRFKLLLPFQHGKPLPEGRSSGCPNGRRRLLGISRFLMDASVFQRRMVLFDRHPNIPECLGLSSRKRINEHHETKSKKSHTKANAPSCSRPVRRQCPYTHICRLFDCAPKTGPVGLSPESKSF